MIQEQNPCFPRYIYETDSIWWYKPTQAHSHVAIWQSERKADSFIWIIIISCVKITSSKSPKLEWAILAHSTCAVWTAALVPLCLSALPLVCIIYHFIFLNPILYDLMTQRFGAPTSMILTFFILNIRFHSSCEILVWFSTSCILFIGLH